MQDAVTVFLCGDVMTGRGIDQILPHPGSPVLYEPFMKSAVGYITLAEDISGPIPRKVDFNYIWGDSLKVLEEMNPDFRIINLETSITRSDSYEKRKEVHYRMNPDNAFSLAAAKINCCCLANNHVLDFGYQGLFDTFDSLDAIGIKRVGAGRNLAEAQAPAILDTKNKSRVIVFSFGSLTSGIPGSWAASQNRPGVNLLEDSSSKLIGEISKLINSIKRDRDVVILSIHWGSNWGFSIPDEQVKFAHGLIDSTIVNIVYGHSSHHVKGIEIYKNRPILYGCGDFLNDYEGITGYEMFRGDLGLMYFISINLDNGDLMQFQMIPTRIKLFKVNRASPADTGWLVDTLNREGVRLGTRVEFKEGILNLK
jgi:poly-gamma-glutamate capsule biosynthesis protein CapA/YwtB (metallophosphatase superfamily)